MSEPRQPPPPAGVTRPDAATPRRPRTVVLGIGNLLMGDEGVGVHVVRALQGRPGPGAVEFVDGGTGGFHLLEYFQAFRRVILVDATLDGRPPGSLTVLRPRFSSDYPPTLTAHDIGLKDLLDAAHLMDYRPEVVLFAVSVRQVDRPDMEMTAAVRAAVPEVSRAILRYLETGELRSAGPETA